MSEDLQRKLTNAVENYVEQLDKSHLRKLGQMTHLCAAECLKDTSSSRDYVQNCVVKCAGNLEKAQARMESDLTHIQNRLSRCHQGCQDSIRDSLGANPTSEDFKKHEKQMDTCLSKCADEIMTMLPKTLKKCQEYFDYNLK